MARKEFEHFEAVSAVVPVELGGNKGYHAAIAVKALVDGGAPRFHKLLNDQVFPAPSRPMKPRSTNWTSSRASPTTPS